MDVWEISGRARSSTGFEYLSMLQWWLLIAEGRFAERHYLPGNRKLIGRESNFSWDKKREIGKELRDPSSTSRQLVEL